jgi:prepilin-type N-terminal cleavage/methylation domain-containing protein
MMMRLARIRESRDRGFTLVELLVATVVFSGLMAALTTTVILTMQSSRNTDARNQDLSRVQVSLDDMAKLMRTTARPPVPPSVPAPTAFISANARDVKFYGYTKPGAAPSIVHYYVNASNQLVEEMTPSVQCAWPYTWDPAAMHSRILARNLSPNQTVFTYNVLPTVPFPQGSPLPTAGSPPAVAAADLGNIDNVVITLSVDLPTSPDIPPTVATTQVQLRNLDSHIANELPEQAC